MFAFVIVIILAIIINGLLGDYIHGTDMALTPAGLNLTFSGILVIAGFWNPMFFAVAFGIVFAFGYNEFNGYIYRN